LLGDTSWSNYTVSSDVYIDQPATVELYGRANTQTRPQSDQNAYLFRASDTGAWSIDKTSISGTITALASGTTTALGTGTWHTMSLTMQGPTISASLDGKQLGSVTDTSFQTGQVGIGVVGYQTDQFDNLKVTPGSGTVTIPTGPVASGMASMCLDDENDSTTNGNPVVISTCDGSAEQNWTVGNGTAQVNGMCLDVIGNTSTAYGTLVDLWSCNGGGNQEWIPEDGTLVNPQSGKCLDDPGFSTTPGTQLDIWDCNGGVNQQWTLPSPPSTPPSVTGAIVSGLNTSDCLAEAPGSAVNGTAADLRDCAATTAQDWTVGDGTVQAGGECLNATGDAGNGAPVNVGKCDQSANQQWMSKNGTLVN
jgi:hypothetical protein